MDEWGVIYSCGYDYLEEANEIYCQRGKQLV